MEQVRSARRHLADLIDDRREELRLTLAELAQLAGVSRETIRQIRTSDSEIRPLTRRGIEDALQWEAGSIAAVLAGGEPTPGTQTSPEETPDKEPEEDPHVLLQRGMELIARADEILRQRREAS